jgi:molybdenum cofactor biosynthesis protein B
MGKAVKEFVPVTCAVLTVSDTRTMDQDTSGAYLADGLREMGHTLKTRELMKDDIDLIRGKIRSWIADDDVKVVVVTGGTGLTRRDVTPDAIEPLADKAIPGFGELFRWLSYADIGSSTVQSRAGAWLCGGTLVFALPGSTGAVRLGFDKILVEQLDSRHKPCNFINLLPRIA